MFSMNGRGIWLQDTFHTLHIFHSHLVFKVSCALNLSRSDLIHIRKDMSYWVTCFDLQLGSINQLSTVESSSYLVPKNFHRVLMKYFWQKNGQNRYFVFSFKLHMQECWFHSEQKHHVGFLLFPVLCRFIVCNAYITSKQSLFLEFFKYQEYSWFRSKIS